MLKRKVARTMPMKLRTEIPDFAGVTEWLNGNVDKETLHGHSVLVHFWAISCHMCKEGLPLVNHWREVYGEPYHLKVIGVHTPRSEKDLELEPVKKTIRKYELTHPVIIDNAHTVADAFQNECVPAYYLFDNKLQLRHIQAGDRGLQMLDQRIQRILGVKP